MKNRKFKPLIAVIIAALLLTTQSGSSYMFSQRETSVAEKGSAESETSEDVVSTDEAEVIELSAQEAATDSSDSAANAAAADSVDLTERTGDLILPEAKIVDATEEEVEEGREYYEELVATAEEALGTTVEEVVEETGVTVAEANSSILKSYTDSSDWSDFSSNYYYNIMGSDYRAVLDAMDAACLDILTNGEDCDSSVTVTVEDCNGDISSSEDIYNLLYTLIYDNPQYYFLGGGISCSYSQEHGVYTYTVTISVDEDFVSGTFRDEINAAVLSEVGEFVDGVTTTDECEIAKEVHDYVCANTVYDTELVDDLDQRIDGDQTIYSFFCTDQTVCAGYAAAFELLCNACGVDALVNISSSHAWNRVRVDYKWYNVDCTWDDCDNSSVCIYTYFMRDDTYFGSLSYHTTCSSIRENPECNYDAYDESTDTLTVVDVDGTLDAGTISAGVAKSKGYRTVTFENSGSLDVDYYYIASADEFDSTDDSPAINDVKCICGESLTVTADTYIRVVMVRDNYTDSGCATIFIDYSESEAMVVDVTTTTSTTDGTTTSTSDATDTDDSTSDDSSSSTDSSSSDDSSSSTGSSSSDDSSSSTDSSTSDDSSSSTDSSSSDDGSSSTDSSSSDDGSSSTDGSSSDDGSSSTDGSSSDDSSSSTDGSSSDDGSSSTDSSSSGDDSSSSDSDSSDAGSSSGSGAESSSESTSGSSVDTLVDTSGSGQSSAFTVTVRYGSAVCTIECEIVGSSITVTGGSGKVIVIPDSVTRAGVTYKVTKIANGAFAKDTSIKKVIIGKNITNIGKKAFFKCSGIKKVIIYSTGVKKVGKKAFKGLGKKAKIKLKMTSKYKKKLKKKIKKSKIDKTTVIK
ncbi:MAG: leucine-rich repeat protein [Eubacterium sp.]|nr:leucine-rich repeat protein [Eubacterium sp.]